MEDMIPVEQELVEKDEDLLTIEPGKVLNISEERDQFNYHAILGEVLQFVNLGDILGKIEAGTQYVVQVPVNYQDALNAGELFMMQGKKTGIMWPTLMRIAENGKNEIVQPLPIVEHAYVEGNPLQQISASYYNLLMQQQMAKISQRLEDTYKVVKSIEAGQTDDRIGLLEAGRNGILLALSMPDGQERRMQINGSRQNLLVAQSQIGKTLERKIAEFAPIPQHSFGRFVKVLARENYLDEKDNEIEQMQEYFDLYIHATNMLAASYAVCGDERTAKQTYDLARDFISKIDYSKVKTIEFAHIETPDMFYKRPKQVLEEEQLKCIESSRPYDYIAVEVSGKELLEAWNHE